MNLGVVIGNLGADAQVKKSEEGKEFCVMRVADSTKWTSADGKEHESTVWVDVIMNSGYEKLMPYLKAGTKICAIGSQRLRVYSSEKDRCMKAGETINAMRLELCGGSADDVPRQLIDPDTAMIYPVTKFYLVSNPEHLQKYLVDVRMNRYAVDADGWVRPIATEPAPADGQTLEQGKPQEAAPANDNRKKNK